MKNIQEHILNRKAMFIPLLFVSTLGLVGYAAIDRVAPTIDASQIQVLYGTELDKTMFSISDNCDSLDALDIIINDDTYDAYTLGNYNVEVTATDLFSNTITKTVNVEVIDTLAPEIIKQTNGYTIDIEVDSSNNITDYIQAIDNVDGDVTAFIEYDKELDTSTLGSQDITLTVSDNSDNTATETIEFNIVDTTAPTIDIENDTITLDYGKEFLYQDYMTISDNYDSEDDLEVTLDKDIDPISNETQTVTLTVTDTSGNASNVTLTIDVEDISAPEISLTKTSVKIKQDASFDASSYLKSAIDNKDGDLTDEVVIDDSVDTSKTGKYTVSYTVSDSSGNETTETLTVTVQKKYQELVDLALTKVGCSYVWGATGPNTFDCSGFTQWCYRQYGIYIPRTAASQYSATTRVDKSDLEVGDLVFFKGTTGSSGITHVGLYIGGGQFVHASGTKTGVKISSLSESYYVKHYAGGGHVG
ncbi:MAG: NlpC/P60 family protein [Erysipelotrichaceae bacterium]|nr:NlpC/P60 family protein [Erysipelotrichaceae bacterium]